jgi:hypothetical protein
MRDTSDMRIPFVSPRNLIVAGAFALAVTVPSLAATLISPAEPSAQPPCVSGEEGDLFTGTCVPYMVPNSGSTAIGVPQPGMPGPLPASPEEQELADVATPGY